VDPRDESAVVSALRAALDRNQEETG